MAGRDIRRRGSFAGSLGLQLLLPPTPLQRAAVAGALSSTGSFRAHSAH
jgi:hypothetical protein